MESRFSATIGDATHEVAVEPLADGARWRVTIDGQVSVVDARRIASGSWSLIEEGGGRARLVDVAESGETLTVNVGNAIYPMKLVDPRRALAARGQKSRAATGPQPIRAPMPGKVIKVLVKAGEAVKGGQGLVVVEAMKMENELRAPRDGTIGEVSVKEGQNVDSGQVLVTLV